MGSRSCTILLDTFTKKAACRSPPPPPPPPPMTRKKRISRANEANFASGVNAPLRVLHIIPQTRMETTFMFILYLFVILYVEASHALMFSVFVCVNVLVRSWVCRD